jgi:hypothetical protein
MRVGRLKLNQNLFVRRSRLLGVVLALSDIWSEGNGKTLGQ